jgi:hypothetical protein
MNISFEASQANLDTFNGALISNGVQRSVTALRRLDQICTAASARTLSVSPVVRSMEILIETSKELDEMLLAIHAYQSTDHDSSRCTVRH